jgi:hypothetical protein
MNAFNRADIISVLLSVGGGGAAGVGASLAINTIGQLDGREEQKYNDTDAKNSVQDSSVDENKNQKNLVGVVDDSSLFEKIGKSEHTTAVEIVGTGTSVTALGDIDLDSAITGQMVAIAVGGGFGGTAGVGAAAAYNNIGGAGRILADNVSLTAKNGKIIANSESSGKIIAVSIGGGGGGAVGVGVGAAANNLTGRNEISFKNSTTTAKNAIV